MPLPGPLRGLRAPSQAAGRVLGRVWSDGPTHYSLPFGSEAAAVPESGPGRPFSGTWRQGVSEPRLAAR